MFFLEVKLKILDGFVEVTLHADSAKIIQMFPRVFDGRMFGPEVVLNVLRALSVQVVAAELALEADQVSRDRHEFGHLRIDVSNAVVLSKVPTNFDEIGEVVFLVRRRTLFTAEGHACVFGRVTRGVGLVAVDAFLCRSDRREVSRRISDVELPDVIRPPVHVVVIELFGAGGTAETERAEKKKKLCFISDLVNLNFCFIHQLMTDKQNSFSKISKLSEKMNYSSRFTFCT